MDNTTLKKENDINEIKNKENSTSSIENPINTPNTLDLWRER